MEPHPEAGELPGRYALEALPWPEVDQALAEDSRLLFPVGALEQHGPHLPLGTNAFIASRLAEDLSERHRVLRAPTLHYGVALPGARYAGTASLGRKTLLRAVNELIGSWAEHGATEIIVLTAQRHEPHLEALLMATTITSRTTVIDLYSIDVGDLLHSTASPEHAGELETSLMLYLAPDLVRTGRVADFPPDADTLRRYREGEMPTPPKGTLGVVGSPTRASAETGRAVWERYLETCARALSRIHQGA